jgi:hypothetical protein
MNLQVRLFDSLAFQAVFVLENRFLYSPVHMNYFWLHEDSIRNQPSRYPTRPLTCSPVTPKARSLQEACMRGRRSGVASELEETIIARWLRTTIECRLAWCAGYATALHPTSSAGHSLSKSAMPEFVPGRLTGCVPREPSVSGVEYPLADLNQHV